MSAAVQRCQSQASPLRSLHPESAGHWRQVLRAVHVRSRRIYCWQSLAADAVVPGTLDVLVGQLDLLRSHLVFASVSTAKADSSAVGWEKRAHLDQGIAVVVLELGSAACDPSTLKPRRGHCEYRWARLGVEHRRPTAAGLPAVMRNSLGCTEKPAGLDNSACGRLPVEATDVQLALVGPLSVIAAAVAHPLGVRCAAELDAGSKTAYHTAILYAAGAAAGVGTGHHPDAAESARTSKACGPSRADFAGQTCRFAAVVLPAECSPFPPATEA